MCDFYTFIPLNITNEMKSYTIIFIAVSALHVSGGFPPIIRSSNCVYNIWYMSSLHAATASGDELALVGQCQLTQASGSSKRA